MECSMNPKTSIESLNGCGRPSAKLQMSKGSQLNIDVRINHRIWDAKNMYYYDLLY